MAEILAPAGGMPQIFAAVRCGADAVYLGAKGFNARRNAANFDETTLPEAVSYCHARGVKVYVTVNTVILDGELSRLEEEAALIAESGADAVIIQDFAVLNLFKNRYPSLRRFASTQTAVHNLSGALQLQDMGFDSVVLARELTLREMETIIKGIGIQTEAFVHGAHCMSLSGACYLSAMLGGRSGNRGLCAQPCRLDWKDGRNGFALSLKDMSLVSHIREMAEIGVDSFKIEGRMKRPEYVAAAVSACRDALAGQPYDLETLRAVFSRSGFTDGYLTGKRDGTMFGARTKEDVTDAEKVLGSLSGLYHKEVPLIPVDMRFSLTQEKASLTVTDCTFTVRRSSDAPQPAQNRPTDAEVAEKNLKKTGGTPFFLRHAEYEIEPNVMLPLSALNTLRREALEELLALRGAIRPHEKKPFDWGDLSGSTAERRRALWGRFWQREQITGEKNLEKVLLPLQEIDAETIERFGEKLIGELPAVLFPQDEPALKERLDALCAQGLQAIYADNIYGVRLAREHSLQLHGGFGLNITNTPALTELERLGARSATVSFELSMAQIRALGGSLPRGIAAYGRLPLMRFRNCPLKKGTGCAACGGQGALTDRKGIRFPLECDEKLSSTLLNSVPLHIAERNLSGADHLLLWFTRETPTRCGEIIGDYLLRRRTSEPRTSGLYYRELL